MSLTFSIETQTVSLPGLPVLRFRVNPVDTSLVELHIDTKGPAGESGTLIAVFKRNGGPATTSFFATPLRDVLPRSAPLDTPEIGPPARTRLEQRPAGKQDRLDERKRA